MSDDLTNTMAATATTATTASATGDLTPADDVVPTTDVAASPTDSSQKQSPLDVLDQILSEAQDKADGAKEEMEKREEAERIAKKQAQDLANQQLIAQAAAQIETAKESPEYLAKLAQEEDEKKEREQQEAELSGMNIRQLKHTTL